MTLSFIRELASKQSLRWKGGYRYVPLSVSFSTPSLFNSSHSIAFALPSPFTRHSGTQSLSPQITVSIYERGKNQYNTKQWLIGLRVQCAERSLLYIMYDGKLMVSVLADKWTVSISPVWWSHRGDDTHTHTQTNTKLHWLTYRQSGCKQVQSKHQHINMFKGRTQAHTLTLTLTATIIQKCLKWAHVHSQARSQKHKHTDMRTHTHKHIYSPTSFIIYPSLWSTDLVQRAAPELYIFYITCKNVLLCKVFTLHLFYSESHVCFYIMLWIYVQFDLFNSILPYCYFL